MTAIAVQKLVRADSVSIGFIGCGVQVRSHFDVLRLVLPDLKEVVTCSRSVASAERFVAMVRGAGLVARTTLEPREAIEGLDVIITTVPEGAQVLEFLDTAWVTPGAFVGAVDLARSWKRGTLRAMDILSTFDFRLNSYSSGPACRACASGPSIPGVSACTAVP
jgi:ornithine cyclodeaminase/alanine dehydrogenase-like protein (mu-crystallin family)